MNTRRQKSLGRRNRPMVNIYFLTETILSNFVRWREAEKERGNRGGMEEGKDWRGNQVKQEEWQRKNTESEEEAKKKEETVRLREGKNKGGRRTYRERLRDKVRGSDGKMERPRGREWIRNESKHWRRGAHTVVVYWLITSKNREELKWCSKILLCFC